MNLGHKFDDIHTSPNLHIKVKNKRKQDNPKKLELDKLLQIRKHERTRKRKIKILEKLSPIIVDTLPQLNLPIVKTTIVKPVTRKRKIKVLPKSPIVINETNIKPNPETNIESNMLFQEQSVAHIPIKRMNEDFISILGQLSTIESKKGEHFRARAYKKAQETIMSFSEDITSVDQLKDQPGIGKTILAKLQEYIDTGALAKIEKEKDKPEYILSNVYGIGPKKAEELVGLGITNIAQLRQRQDEVLNAVQKVGLKYYEDIEERIPRSEIDEYHLIFDAIFQDIHKTDPSMKYEIVGSYRRGAQQSGDIDVIITSSQSSSYKRFVDTLIEQHIILEILSRGSHKCLVIAKLLTKTVARRVDFLYASPKEYPFSVLYFTGSKEFNTVMRGHALKLGYSMNEHGFSKMDGKQKAEQLISDVFTTELDIFNFLGMQYKRPEERIDGRSVILGTNEPADLTDDSPLTMPVTMPVTMPSILENEQNITQPLLQEKAKKEPKAKAEPKAKKEPKAKTEKVKVREPKNKTKKTDIKIIGDIIQPVDSIMIMHENQTQPTELLDIQAHDTLQNITNFKTKGISVLEQIQEQDLNKMLILANHMYYNENAQLTDNEFDILKEFIERKFPRNTVIDAVGAPISGRNKVKLPFEMWSMDKIKPDSNALSQWKTKYTGPYTLSCKLDGVSGMYVLNTADKPNNQYKLYTRGNGLVGQDISHLIEPMHLPKITGPLSQSTIAIRGEFIIPKRVFQDKYKDKFANPRNMVAGIINKQSHDERITDLKFVVYEIIEPKMKPSQQLRTLTEMGFDTVMFRQENADTLTNELLSSLLLDWRKSYEFEVDGVIVTDDHIHGRISGNPEHAFAFKMVISDQMAEAKVVDVLWEASKNGYLKPRVRIEPINLGGVRIEYATGFNGRFIEENRIGVGALIQLVRSGDVIPYIQSIVQPAEHPLMPQQSYHWTDSHVDIILDDLDSDPKVLEKNIVAFFTELEVDGLAKGNIKRLMDAGFDSVAKIIRMTKSDFVSVGFKTLADKFVSSISTKIAAASLPTIMSASNKLGRGISGKTVETIMTEEPDILTSSDSNDIKIAKLVKIKGVGKVVAKTFVEHIGEFLDFLRECGLLNKLNPATNTLVAQPVRHLDETHPLFGKKIVMTKVRDAYIIQKMEELRAILADAVTSDTFAVIVKSKDDMSAKVKKALEKGIPVMTPDEFRTTYHL